jgi:hypothetical protein
VRFSNHHSHALQLCSSVSALNASKLSVSTLSFIVLVSKFDGFENKVLNAVSLGGNGANACLPVRY